MIKTLFYTDSKKKLQQKCQMKREFYAIKVHASKNIVSVDLLNVQNSFDLNVEHI